MCFFFFFLHPHNSPVSRAGIVVFPILQKTILEEILQLISYSVLYLGSMQISDLISYILPPFLRGQESLKTQRSREGVTSTK